MKVSIWQLANDPKTYGPNADKFILTTPDGEQEVQSAGWVFETALDAILYASKEKWDVVPLEV